MNNLPIPQSRIEVLMNAFISRDSSQISAPQSRIEEFWYHLIEGTNALPIPQSRIELLLKKIIENDTEQIPLAKSRAEEFLVSILTGDINKLPIPQSRSEYYLDYITRNNLVLDDIEYVKYSDTNITASNTVQKPFRSAILKGQTLVNLAPKVEDSVISNYQSGNVILTSEFKPLTNLKANTEYTVLFKASNVVNATNGMYQYQGRDAENVFIKKNIKNYTLVDGYNKLTFTTSVEISKIQFLSYNTLSVGGSCCIHGDSIMIIEGDYTNVDIPYFTGMQSVKMPVLTTTGKNLWRTDLFSSAEIDTYYRSTNYTLKQLCPDLIVGETYTFSMDYQYTGSITGLVGIAALSPFTDLTYKPIIYTEELGNSLIYLYGGNATGVMTNFQVEKGSTTTPYEPYKSNILTVNEPIELRGIGDVKDTLDGNAGELTQRIGGFNVSSIKKWNVGTELENTIQFVNAGFSALNNASPRTDCLGDIIPYGSGLIGTDDKEQFFVGNDLSVRILKSKLNGVLTPEKFIEWLSSVDFNITYQLATESIKTVGLKVVDQDGNPVKQLSAFDETTHIVSSSASDNSLIAIAVVEVPTKLIEALNDVKSLSSDVEILINEVDNAQKLQDENSTMVMSTMTELYEMVLMIGGGS